MPSPPITIQPIDQPFDVTFPDVERGIPPIPGSKSLTNRALLLAALAEGKSTLTGVLFSDDTRVMMKALQDLGFTLDIDEPNTTVTVHGQGGKIPAKKADLHLGNAGTAMRFLTAACCLGEPGSVYTLRGIDRMHERPIGELVEPLRQLGAKIEYLGEEGFPPLRIHACGLAGGTVPMNPSVSSQFVSALLLISPYCNENQLTIEFTSKPVSYPYIKMTLDIMETFGCDVAEDMQPDNQIYAVQASSKCLQAHSGRVEPDASNASYFFAVAAVTPRSIVRVEGLPGTYYLQGDSYFVSKCLSSMGCKVSYDQDGNAIEVHSAETLRGIDIDLNDMPDMAQTLGAIALFADGPTTIRNVGNLRVKETDRMAAMKTELEKLGAKVTINGDDITITPPPGNKITPAAIDTYDDHRMAMAFAVIGLAQPGVTINDPDCVNKTFPGFFKYLDYLRQPPDNAKG